MIRNLYAILIISAVMAGCDQKPKVIVQMPARISSDTLKLSEKWEGNYRITLNDGSEDWRDEHHISLKIKQDSVIYEAEGYQLWEKFQLSAVESGNSLRLTYKTAFENTESRILDSIHDFGTLTIEENKYVWMAPYINARFEADSIKPRYILKKK
jgi:hypothetical protein